MTTLAELDRLLRDTLGLWRRAGWRLGAWFCLGFALHVVGLELSAILGAGHDLAATLCFVAGVTAYLLALIAMINTLRPELRTPAGLPRPRSERFVELITATLGPFLAVYAVWGLVEDEARTLFRANLAERGLGGVTEWSISWAPERLPFYAALLAGSWLVRFAVQRLQRRVLGSALAVVGVAAEAVVVFATFATLIIAGKRVGSWLRTRAVVVELDTLWRRLVAALPDLTLPFHLTLPRLVTAVADWVWHTALPALGTGIALPLMWLALCTVVFGWRGFEARSSRPTRRILLAATADLRTKYVPVLQALRLVLAGGPRLVGVYLVLATALGALHDGVLIAVTVLVGPTSYPLALAIDPSTELIAGLVTQPVLICLYVATIDRALTVGADPSRPRPTARPRPRDLAPTPAPGS